MSVQAITQALDLRDVSPSEKLVILVLANYADENMRAYPSHRRLAAETGLSDRTILTTLKGLEARGLLVRQPRSRPDGSRSSDLITLKIGGEMVSPRGEIDSKGVGKQFPQGGEMVSPLTTFEPSINQKIERPSEPDGFDLWWEAYPRKESKGTARKAYKSALNKTTSAILLLSLQRASFSLERQYQPLPATWLNGERWLDALPDPPCSGPPPDPWRQRMTRWKHARYWDSEWGPKPGKPGCLAPEAYLEDQAA